MFKTFRLAAHARAAKRILDNAHPGGTAFTLPEQAEVVVGLIDGLIADKTHLVVQMEAARISLAAANAKIARMTSGLKRGSSKQ